MKRHLTFKVQKEPGFRFNLTDLFFILLLVCSSALLWHFFEGYYALYLLPLYIGFTFFLFCNVFRVTRRKEVIWIVTFFALSAVSHQLFEAEWFFMAAALASTFQAIEIFFEIRSKGYKGISFREKKTVLR